jgi:hypothetical protein
MLMRSPLNALSGASLITLCEHGLLAIWVAGLPLVPVSPSSELVEWCVLQLARLGADGQPVLLHSLHAPSGSRVARQRAQLDALVVFQAPGTLVLDAADFNQPPGSLSGLRAFNIGRPTFRRSAASEWCWSIDR